MFVGHYSPAFVAKALEPRVPLWVYLLAAQLVDVLWGLFVLVGVEGVRIDPSLPSNPLDLHTMPYTHSLLGTLLWASAAGLWVARAPRLGGTARGGVAVAAVVASHWLLDLLVHRPDLTLWGAPPRLGLGLWNLPPLAFALEVALVVGAALWAVRRGRLAGRERAAVLGLAAALVALQAATLVTPAPRAVPALIATILALFAAVTWAGARAERWATASA